MIWEPQFLTLGSQFLSCQLISSEKNRCPSWTDRILWRSNLAVKALNYESSPSHVMSISLQIPPLTKATISQYRHSLMSNSKSSSQNDSKKSTQVFFANLIDSKMTQDQMFPSPTKSSTLRQ